MAATDRDVADLIGRAEALLERVESGADPALRADAVELVRALLELYGEGLARLTAAAVRAGGEPLAAEFADDDLISHLLLLHGLHPVDVPTRVAAAVAATATRLGGVGAELVGVADDVVRLRLPASGTGCGGSSTALRTALEEAIRAAAPEIERVEVEQLRPPPALIPVASLWQGRPGGGRRASSAGVHQ